MLLLDPLPLQLRGRVRAARPVTVEEGGVAVGADPDVLQKAEVRERGLVRAVPPADGAAAVAAVMPAGEDAEALC